VRAEGNAGLGVEDGGEGGGDKVGGDDFLLGVAEDALHLALCGGRRREGGRKGGKEGSLSG